MAITFPCPDCKSMNTFEEAWAGLRAPCTSCGSYLTVPGQSSGPVQIASGMPPQQPARASAPPPPLPAASSPAWITDLPKAKDYETGDYARRDRDRDDDDRWSEDDRERMPYRAPAAGWTTVRIGLGLMFWGTIAFVILYVLLIALMILMLGVAFGGMGGGGGGFQRGPRSMDAFGVVALMFGGGLFLASLVVFIGKCMCCTVPTESGTRGLIVWSTVCTVLWVVLTILMIFFLFVLTRGGFGGGPFGPRFGGPPDMSEIFLPLLFGVTILIIWVANHVLFIQFLKGTARYFRNESAAQSTTGYLTLFFVSMVLYVVFNFAQFLVRDQQVMMMVGCFALVILGLGIACLVWYLILIARTRGSIS